MDNSKTVWEEVSGGLDIMKIGNTEMPSRAYVGRFNFKGVDQGKRVGELSGGERGRLHLAKLLQVGGNVLLLDEPTNDLDIETLRALENALLEFPGCAMVISHDRWFLDRIATHILDYQDEGKVEFFEGNFTEYEEYKKRTSAPTRWSRSVSSTNVFRNKSKKATQVAFFNVCSLSHGRGPARALHTCGARAPNPPSALLPAPRSAETGHRNPTLPHAEGRSRSLSAATPAALELCDPPSSQTA
jgi:energy-coupling factor transporter ATP-binding protein EcfA2